MTQIIGQIFPRSLMPPPQTDCRFTKDVVNHCYYRIGRLSCLFQSGKPQLKIRKIISATGDKAQVVVDHICSYALDVFCGERLEESNRFA